MNKTTTKQAPRARGRQSIYDEPMQRINVNMGASVKAQIKKLGGGNLNRGLRRAAAISQIFPRLLVAVIEAHENTLPDDTRRAPLAAIIRAARAAALKD